ncbi:sugar ABC transporter permease, partial [Vibrio parahaemolyticus]|nr:sugar ABC transporter permease [Vibrio parahaemolyticus]
LTSFYAVTRDFISHGMWGLVTLGENLPEDNSVFLLAEGIIASLVVVFGLAVYVLSINDAYKNGQLLDEGRPLNSLRVQYRNVINAGFPYLMISPGFILLVFVVVFPIIFGFAIGFTNYNLYNSPPAKLVDWVGLKNFFNIFQINLWRNTFIDVLQWTVVWTLVASTLQCTVGVLLAILV